MYHLKITENTKLLHLEHFREFIWNTKLLWKNYQGLTSAQFEKTAPLVSASSWHIRVASAHEENTLLLDAVSAWDARAASAHDENTELLAAVSDLQIRTPYIHTNCSEVIVQYIPNKSKPVSTIASCPIPC